MHPVVPQESFNPDPDARYYRSLAEAFPAAHQPLLLRLQEPTLLERLGLVWRRLIARIRP